MKKLLIADYLSSNLVNRVFDFPTLYTGAETLIAVYAYALQIYYDFSGYTDIAIGSALLLGIKLPPNFNRPYAAENIADFWRRWHISLSNWLRDYLYFSLPGKRSKIFSLRQPGDHHGDRRIVARRELELRDLGRAARLRAGLRAPVADPIAKPTAPASPFWRYASIVLTFHYVTFAWIFFRAPSFDDCRRDSRPHRFSERFFREYFGPVVLVLLIGIAGALRPQEMV